MRIGVDIDGVINNLAQFHLECGAKFCYEHHLAYNLNPAAYEVRDIFGWTNTHYREFQTEYYKTFFLTYTYIRPFSSEALRILRERNELYIITARKPRLPAILGLPSSCSVSELTMRWLASAGIEYDQFLLTDWDKREALRQNKIDVMIEDSPLFLALPLEGGCTQIICFDTDYNRSVPETPIQRAYSWYDALRLIERKEPGLQ